jgi:hypothetical protein
MALTNGTNFRNNIPFKIATGISPIPKSDVLKYLK